MQSVDNVIEVLFPMFRLIDKPYLFCRVTVEHPYLNFLARMMRVRSYVAVIFVGFVLGFLIIFQHAGQRCFVSKRPSHEAGHYLDRAEDTPHDLHNTLKEQRNALSKELNELRKRLGKMDCEVTKIFFYLHSMLWVEISADNIL